MADATENNNDAAPKSGKKGAIAFIAVGLFCLVSSVTVGLLAFPSTGHEETPNRKKETERVTSLMPVPQILVNLRDSNGQRLLQSSVSLEMMSPDDATVQTVFNDMLPKIQDKLIKVLSAYTADELDGGNRKDAVQTRVMQHLNETLFKDTDVEIAGVYFTEFVIQ